MTENGIFACKKCGKKVSQKIYFVDSLCADCNIEKHKDFLSKQTYKKSDKYTEKTNFKYIKISEKKEKFYIEKI